MRTWRGGSLVFSRNERSARRLANALLFEVPALPQLAAFRVNRHQTSVVHIPVEDHPDGDTGKSGDKSLNGQLPAAGSVRLVHRDRVGREAGKGRAGDTVPALAGGLMLLSFPVFPIYLQAIGNNLAAAALLVAGLVWYIRNPPLLETIKQNEPGSV